LAGKGNLNSVLGFDKNDCSCAAETFHWERKPDDNPGDYITFVV
jgi:hypothetical protein